MGRVCRRFSIMVLNHFLWQSHHCSDRKNVSGILHKLTGGLSIAPLGSACASFAPMMARPVLICKVVYILSAMNLTADFLLHPQTVRLIWQHFDREEVDLFDLSKSASPVVIPVASCTSGDRRTCSPMAEAAFLRLPPIPSVLSRLQEDKICLLQVALLWQTHIWFMKQISFLESPWEIPIRADLLMQAQGRICHPRTRIWTLWVWPLNRDP